MAEKIIELIKNEVGDLVEVKLESGEVVSYVRAKQMAKNDEIEFVNAFKGEEESHLEQ